MSSECKSSSHCEQTISHRGRIVSIDSEYTTVEIISEAACASCHAKGLCGLGESKKKEIQVQTRGWDNYTVGQEVTVELKASMGQRAVWLAYVAPLMVLIIAILTLTLCGVGELLSGLFSLAAVGVYYFALWCFRKKLKKEYIFNLK